MVRFDRKAPRPLNTKDTATRARDAASRLEDYEHRLVASLSIGEASAEGAAGPPGASEGALPHSYIPRPPKHGRSLGNPARLRVPPSLQRYNSPPKGRGGAASEASLAAAAEGADRASSPPSYQHVRRWDQLPKREWLQGAESGHAPGPGYREMSPQQKRRSYGPPDRLEPLKPSASEPAAAEAAASTPRAVGPSAKIGANYSPSAAGLSPASLAVDPPKRAAPSAARPASSEERPASADWDDEGDDEATAAAAARAAAAAGELAFLPLELFDGGDLETLDRTEWAQIATKHEAGEPVGARSKFRAADGGTSWLPCDVVAYEEKEGADHFLLEWHDSKKLKWATRFNVLFNAEDEAAFHARLAAAVALRRRVEGDARRRFFADHNTSGGALATISQRREDAIVARVAPHPADGNSPSASPAASPRPGGGDGGGAVPRFWRLGAK